MGEILKDHALINLWCEPRQDRQFVIQPARLTPNGGALKYAPVLWESIPLPNAANPLDKGFYHVYQIGQLSPVLFDIQMAKETWVSAQELCEALNLTMDVFVANGCRLPRHETWLRINTDNNVILAVRYMPYYDLGGSSLNQSDLFVRFYSNARFDAAHWRDQAIDPINGIRVVSRYISSQADYLAFSAACNAVEAEFGTQGGGAYQIDGYLVTKPGGWTNSYQGKVMSFTWDSSVKRIVTMPLASLPAFVSTLDPGQGKRAMILEGPYAMIDFHDDVDFYLTHVTGNSFKGVYIGRIRGDEVRQLTHTAYALREQTLDDLMAAHSFFASPGVTSIRAIVREGGMVRGLKPQHNRIDELYKLEYSEVVAAISGQDNSTVTEWLAAELEASAYTAVMRTEFEQVTDTMVEDAYGYNVSTLVACDPFRTVESHPYIRHTTPPISAVTRYVTPPPVMNLADRETNNGLRTVYVYDDGLLKGWFNDYGLYQPIPIPEGLGAASHAECFNYETSAIADGTFFDTDISDHALAQYGFRCYACPILGGVPSEVWTDITGTAYYTYDPVGTLANGFRPRIVWNWYLLDAGNLYPAIRINNRMHLFAVPHFTNLGYNGVIRFTLTSQVEWLNVVQTRPISIPPGTIDVFMNGRSLIQGIDYYVEWPEIVIVRRPVQDGIVDDRVMEVEVPVEDIDILVRTYGFCDPDTMRPYPPRDIGFAKGGILSVNGQYDIRNDRTIRTQVAGRLIDPMTVKFAENDTGGLVTDGRPYAINDYMLPVENFTGKSFIPFRDVSYDLDERVIDYLTPRLPEAPVLYPSIITERWAVVSPFCSRLLHALISGELPSGPLAGSYTALDVAGWVLPYEDLLVFDPCVKPETDFDYLLVLAHQYDTALELTADQYRFMEYIIANYLNGRIDLTPSVIIG